MSAVIGYATNRTKNGNVFLDNDPSSTISYGIFPAKHNLLFNNLAQACLNNNLDTVIYIHGFNYTFQSFEDRLYDIHDNFKSSGHNKDVNIIGLDWTSVGDFSLDAGDLLLILVTGGLFSVSKAKKFKQHYRKDQTLVADPDNTKAISSLLTDVLKIWGKKEQKLFLMTHSMGTHALGLALSDSNFSKGMRNFNATFLLASDADSNILDNGQLLNPLFSISNKVYNYHVETDLALQLSDQIIGNPPRLGQVGSNFLSQNFYDIELKFKSLKSNKQHAVTGVNLEHHYYDYKYDFVINDIIAVMDNGHGRYSKSGKHILQE